jgi:hydroxymethylbilane synthase
MRGNVGTRIEKVRRGEVAATLLARAGLTRLELMHESAEVIDVERMVPAAAQGALGIVVYAGADEALAAVEQLDHAATHAAADAERAVLRALGGGCHLPVGAHAHQPTPGRLLLRTRVVSTDGDRTIETTHETALEADPATWRAAANTLGERAAAELIEQGAEELLG